MNDFGRNYPADNHWGNLKKKDETGKDKEYSLHVQAPGIEITGLDKSITEMCATMSAVLEDGASDVFLGDMYEAGQAAAAPGGHEEQPDHAIREDPGPGQRRR